MVREHWVCVWVGGGGATVPPSTSYRPAQLAVFHPMQNFKNKDSSLPLSLSQAATLFVFFFLSSSWRTNVEEMNDLWCSSTVWLLSTQTRVNVKDPSMLG